MIPGVGCDNRGRDLHRPADQAFHPTLEITGNNEVEKGLVANLHQLPQAVFPINPKHLRREKEIS